MSIRVLRWKTHGFSSPMVIGGQPLNKRFVRYMVSFMGGHAGSRKIRRFLLPRSTNLRGRSPSFEGGRKTSKQREPSMSELTSRKELKQISKSVVLAVLCLFFASVVYAQGERCQYEYTDVHEINGRTVLKSTDLPVNGVACDYQFNGEVIKRLAPDQQAALLELMQRVVDGSTAIEQTAELLELFQKKGLLNVSVETTFKDGKRDGITRVYFESGKLQGETSYKDGNMEGITRMYYESGRLEKEISLKNNKLNGITRGYFENGKPQGEISYKDGNKEGIAKIYYESGTLQSETSYKDDKRDGITRVYYESGRLESETTYKNDKKEGYEQHYIETGQLWGKLLYKNDELVSGTCADGRSLTNAELINWQNSHNVSCGH